MTPQELTLSIEKALEEIRPFLNSDGGDIILISIEDEKHVKVKISWILIYKMSINKCCDFVL